MTSSEIYREADRVTTKEIRAVAPAHYVLKLKSFSLFAKNNVEKYESSEFEAGGCKWKLILYPNGDKSRNGEDHVSIYLAASEASRFKLDGEIHAAFRFCLYDHIRDRYLTEQGRVMRFHALKTELGAPRYMPLKTFTNPSNGYLEDDTCIFGVEVFVIKSSGVGECLTLEENVSYTHKYNVSRKLYFEDEAFSDVFIVGDHKWKMRLLPWGDSANLWKDMSMFLILVDADKLASGKKVNTRFTLRLRGKNDVVYRQQTAWTRWFSSSTTSWGWSSFMPRTTAWERQPDGSCVIEAEVTVLGTVSKLP